MELEEQRRALFHLARVAVLGQLSGALAHELSQPLASILSNADAARNLLRRQPPDLVEVSAILDDIAGEDRRAAQVIQRLRALLKRGEMRVQALNLGEVVNEVLELSRAELNMRGVSATAALEPNLPLVLGDRVQLQQVLLNLILNACEAMKTTLEPDRTILLSVRADAKRCVRVAVRDHGTGISPEVIDRLFEPFVTTKPEGLGLGLAISRTIVMAHGGRLWAENNADRGATVHCVLSYDDTHAASHGGSPGTQRSTVERLADTRRSQEPLAGLSSVSNLPRLPRGAA
jgi:two-component system sensor kinase FixL